MSGIYAPIVGGGLSRRSAFKESDYGRALTTREIQSYGYADPRGGKYYWVDTTPSYEPVQRGWHAEWYPSGRKPKSRSDPMMFLSSVFGGALTGAAGGPAGAIMGGAAVMGQIGLDYAGIDATEYTSHAAKLAEMAVAAGLEVPRA